MIPCSADRSNSGVEITGRPDCLLPRTNVANEIGRTTRKTDGEIGLVERFSPTLGAHSNFSLVPEFV